MEPSEPKPTPHHRKARSSARASGPVVPAQNSGSRHQPRESRLDVDDWDESHLIRGYD